MIILIDRQIIMKLVYFKRAVEINLTFLESNHTKELRAMTMNQVIVLPGNKIE